MLLGGSIREAVAEIEPRRMHSLCPNAHKPLRSGRRDLKRAAFGETGFRLLLAQRPWSEGGKD